MNFWFGKKQEEQNSKENVSCDVLAEQNHAEESQKTGLPLFVAAQPNGANAESQGSIDASISSPAAKVAGLNDLSTQPQENEVQAVKEPKMPELKVPATVVEVKQIVRPLGAVPVRVVAHQGAPLAAASVRVPSVLTPTAVVPPSAPVFGLRLKAKDAPEASADSASLSAVKTPPTAGKTNETPKDEDHAIIRPKVDQRALYYELMNGLYDAVLLLDDQGHVVDSNSRVVDVLGYSREESWDLPIKKIISGMTPQVFEHLRRSLTENNHVLIDARCLRKNESSFMGEVGVSTLSLTRAGSNIVFAIRNVERRKNAMEELRKGQLAMQVALAPAFVCDTEGFFQIVNQALLDAFGIPDEKQAKSVRFVDLLPDAARFFLRAACGEKIKESIQVSLPQGGTAKVDFSLCPVQNGQDVTAVAGSLLQA